MEANANYASLRSARPNHPDRKLVLTLERAAAFGFGLEEGRSAHNVLKNKIDISLIVVCSRNCKDELSANLSP